MDPNTIMYIYNFGTINKIYEYYDEYSEKDKATNYEKKLLTSKGSWKNNIVFIGDDERSIKLARYVKPFGMLAGVFYAGVGLVPHDLHFGWHVFFAHGAFSLLLIVCSLHALAVYHSKKLNNAYAFGYLLFCFFLATYLCIIFLGPEIGPNRVYSESDLILQVVAQKMIVLTFTCSILIQIHGIKKVFKEL